MDRVIDDRPAYSLGDQGIYIASQPVAHRDDEYDSATFEILCDMQRRHFWCMGRHRFLLRALRSQMKSIPRRNNGLNAIDLGGGCGGWVSYLRQHAPDVFNELAISDSSLEALKLAKPFIGEDVARYQSDLLNLHWRDRWDVAFLLDVLEHIPEDEQVFRQVWSSLRPGGLLFVTTPALKFFWSQNDEMAHHVRRYSRADLERLAITAGFENCRTRYFMFFLSPLLLLSRLKRVDMTKLTREEIQEHLRRTHRVPFSLLNHLLYMVFASETPLGYWLPFPWGTSVLGVFRKPVDSSRNVERSQ
jgi:SAM-dependent methyltransferase